MLFSLSSTSDCTLRCYYFPPRLEYRWVLEMSDCVRLLCGTGEDWSQTQVLGFQTKVLLIVPEYIVLLSSICIYVLNDAVFQMHI